MKKYIMVLEYTAYECRTFVYQSTQFDRVTKRENFTTTASSVDRAMAKAKEWCIANRHPWNGEVTVTNIYTEEISQ